MEVTYKKGEHIKLTIFDVDSLGIQYSKEVEGTVVQNTKNLITIDNGKYKETYQLSQLIQNNEVQPTQPYEFDDEGYKENIVDDCIRVIKEGKYGYLFNLEQLKILQDKLSDEIVVEDKNGILKIKLKK